MDVFQLAAPIRHPAFTWLFQSEPQERDRNPTGERLGGVASIAQSFILRSIAVCGLRTHVGPKAFEATRSTLDSAGQDVGRPNSFVQLQLNFRRPVALFAVCWLIPSRPKVDDCQSRRMAIQQFKFRTHLYDTLWPTPPSRVSLRATRRNKTSSLAKLLSIPSRSGSDRNLSSSGQARIA